MKSATNAPPDQVRRSGQLFRIKKSLGPYCLFWLMDIYLYIQGYKSISNHNRKTARERKGNNNMKKSKILFTYKMDLNAFQDAIKSKYFKDKYIDMICLDGPVKFPFGEKRVMSIYEPIFGVRDRKGQSIRAMNIYEVVGPSFFMAREYTRVCELKKNGEFSK